MSKHDIIFSIFMVFKEFNESRGDEYHDVEMARVKMRHELMDILHFKKKIKKNLAVENALEFEFEINHIMTSHKMLDPTNMQSRQVNID